MVSVKGGMEKAGPAVQPSSPAPPLPLPSPHHTTNNTNSDPLNGTNKILGRNANGIMVVTTAPGNEAELQLYRVLQRASLLAYYDTLLEMGGDDVQQLCDAGEEEFLEIMALVGMASKPLHVRRLQKALHEWVTNPAAFRLPIAPAICPEAPFLPRLPPPPPQAAPSPEIARPAYSPSPGAPETAPRNSSPSPQLPPSSHSSPGSASSPVPGAPCLLESQIRRLAAAAERLSRHLPQLEPRPQNAKKKMCKDLEAVMMMPEDDPRRMEEIRKYAAIYGRFDCKRKPEKPLTLHEVSVNEAAAQMCRAVPALLTRRDELFPLARQVVRLSGFHYSKGQSQISSPYGGRSRSDSEGVGGGKRARLERTTATPEGKDDDLLRGRGIEGRVEGDSDLGHSYSASGMWTRADSDDGDSRYSFSNSCSPPLPDQEENSRSEIEGEGGSSGRVRVVAASGDHIIAVANPALALLSRPILTKRESVETIDNN